MHALYNRLEWIKANITELDGFLKKDRCMSIDWRKIFQNSKKILMLHVMLTALIIKVASWIGFDKLFLL